MKPLPRQALEGRVNPKGVPCLYVATTRQAALSEVRPWIGSLISVAQFKTLRKLKLVDCSVYHAARSAVLGLIFLDHEPTQEDRDKAVWTDIDHAFSKPVTRSDDTADYAATQILAELFRAEGYDGVAYKSAFGDDGYNIALFDIECANQLNGFLFEARNATFEFVEAANPYFLQEAASVKAKVAKRRNR